MMDRVLFAVPLMMARHVLVRHPNRFGRGFAARVVAAMGPVARTDVVRLDQPAAAALADGFRNMDPAAG